MSIQLYAKLGLNPRMCFCPSCGGDSPSLAMLGNRNFKTQCTTCQAWNYGSRPSEKCAKCRETIGGKSIKLDDYERVPGAVCENCEAIFAEMQRGGVAGKCEAGCFFAISAASEAAKQIRADHNITAPNPIGIEFSADDCPNKDNHK